MKLNPYLSSRNWKRNVYIFCSSSLYPLDIYSLIKISSSGDRKESAREHQRIFMSSLWWRSVEELKININRTWRRWRGESMNFIGHLLKGFCVEICDSIDRSEATAFEFVIRFLHRNCFQLQSNCNTRKLSHNSHKFIVFDSLPPGIKRPSHM